MTAGRTLDVPAVLIVAAFGSLAVDGGQVLCDSLAVEGGSELTVDSGLVLCGELAVAHAAALSFRGGRIVCAGFVLSVSVTGVSLRNASWNPSGMVR